MTNFLSSLLNFLENLQIFLEIKVIFTKYVKGLINPEKNS